LALPSAELSVLEGCSLDVFQDPELNLGDSGVVIRSIVCEVNVNGRFGGSLGNRGTSRGSGRESLGNGLVSGLAFIK